MIQNLYQSLIQHTPFRIRRILAGLVDIAFSLCLAYLITRLVQATAIYFSTSLQEAIAEWKEFQNHDSLEPAILSTMKLWSIAICFTVVPWAYFTVLEARWWQAGLGKLVFGIKVVHSNQERPTFIQTFARYFFISGYLACFWLFVMTLGFLGIKLYFLHDFFNDFLNLVFLLYIPVNLSYTLLVIEGVHDGLSKTKVINRKAEPNNP